MANFLFEAALGGFFTALLGWGFRFLPGENWQIFAAVPRVKDATGHWTGLNLTYYGVLVAAAYVLGTAVMFVLMGSIGIPPWGTFALTAFIIAVCAPAARLIARLVEKKRYTFTVGGASFVGILILPWVISALNALTAWRWGFRIPLVGALAAVSIAYAFGEGAGRLACISYGCCYGKPLTQMSPLLQKLFERAHFVFAGKTKKIAYEAGLDGECVVPVQALSAVLSVAAGLAGTALFLAGHPWAALCLSLILTQAWRSISESLRADYRGSGKTSAYQVMAIAGIVYLLLVVALLPTAPTPEPQVVTGLRTLWNPIMILFLELAWLGMFLYTGRSSVTGSSLAFYVHRERI